MRLSEDVAEEVVQKVPLAVPARSPKIFLHENVRRNDVELKTVHRADFLFNQYSAALVG